MPSRIRIARGLRRCCAAMCELGRHEPPVCILSVAGTSSLLWIWDVAAYRVCMGHGRRRNTLYVRWKYLRTVTRTVSAYMSLKR